MKDEQNWRPGDVAEAIVDVVNAFTKQVAMPKGSRHIVADVTIGSCPRGCCHGIGLRFINMAADDWAQGTCFRKIVPTFKEPTCEGRTPIPPRKRALAENVGAYVRRLLPA